MKKIFLNILVSASKKLADRSGTQEIIIVFGPLTGPCRGGARHFHLGGPLEGPVLQQGELSMVCVGLSERDLLRL